MVDEISADLSRGTYSYSKMELKNIVRGVSRLCLLSLNSLLRPKKSMGNDPLVPTENTSLKDNQGWDDYWTNNKPNSRLLYDVIATFYRRYIIKRSLDYFLDKYLPDGSKVLHAGCGSGQVDTNVCERVDLTALDISVNALSLYRRENKDNARLIHGDIFDTKMPDKKFTGIYNLGVMEHFTEKEIRAILVEFRRILSNDGKLILFWPPEYGISVMFFKALVIFFEKILRKSNVKFHPTEITRLQSKDHARRLLDQAGMFMIEYSFSIRDLFTHAVVVAEKKP